MDSKPIKKQQDLTWLENLQKNSWEPEVIISGITLAFLFVMPSRFFDMAVVLIQDFGLEYVPAQLVFWYFSTIISFFKIFLVSHLVLRFIWAGMLGITYAFPNGVLKENLFKLSQDVEFPSPTHFLLKLERWCSMAYGFPISVVIPLSLITVYLIALLGIYLLFGLDFQVVYLIFMLSLIGFGVAAMVFKKSRMRNFVAQSMNGTVSAIYQSNLGKWAFFIYTGVILIFSVPLIYLDILGFSQYQNEVNLSEDSFGWPQQDRYFEEYNSRGRRFGRVWTQQYMLSDSRLNLNLPVYERDWRNLDRVNSLLAHEQDSLQWTQISQVQDLYRIYLNDTLLGDLAWLPITSGLTGQRAMATSIPIDDLAEGPHEIRVEKLVYLSPFLGMGDALRHRKRWARFVFVKVDD